MVQHVTGRCRPGSASTRQWCCYPCRAGRRCSAIELSFVCTFCNKRLKKKARRLSWCSPLSSSCEGLRSFPMLFSMGLPVQHALQQHCRRAHHPAAEPHGAPHPPRHPVHPPHPHLHHGAQDRPALQLVRCRPLPCAPPTPMHCPAIFLSSRLAMALHCNSALPCSSLQMPCSLPSPCP